MEGYVASPISGPPMGRPVGGVAAIAAGYYTEIVRMIAPSEAAAGDIVTVQVTVRAINWHEAFYIGVSGSYNGVDFSYSPNYALVAPGATYTFTYSFTMPSHDVSVDAWTWYWWESEWVYDGEHSYVDITLKVPVAGTITRKELEYDETWGAIPVSNVPQNDRGILHIWGRNDTAITQRMGIYWFVADPDGLVVQEYQTWEAWPYTSPGSEHGFLAGRFDLNKVGKYTTWIELLMNPDNPQVVDQYIGDLCTVEAAVPEPEFRGFAVTEYTKR